MSLGNILIVALMIAIFGVLAAGVLLMGMGGAANRKYGNKLMLARVSLQGLVLLVLLLLFLTSGKS